MDKNGSAEGWMANVKGMIGLNADTYVTGHGDMLTKADLQRKLTAVTERRNKIAAMVKEGKTLEEIKAALPDAPAPGARAAAPPAAAAAAPAAARGPAPGFVDAVYAELTKKKSDLNERPRGPESTLQGRLRRPLQLSPTTLRHQASTLPSMMRWRGQWVSSAAKRDDARKWSRPWWITSFTKRKSP